MDDETVLSTSAQSISASEPTLSPFNYARLSEQLSDINAKVQKLVQGPPEPKRTLHLSICACKDYPRGKDPLTGAWIAVSPMIIERHGLTGIDVFYNADTLPREDAVNSCCGYNMQTIRNLGAEPR